MSVLEFTNRTKVERKQWSLRREPLVDKRYPISKTG